MYRIITIVVFTLLLGSVAGATTTISTDGSWWASVQENSRPDVMFASTSAYQAGFLAGVEAQSAQALAEFKASGNYLYDQDGPVKGKKFMEWVVHWSETHQGQGPVLPDFSGKPMRAYIDGVDYFYSSRPDKTSIDFSSVLQCIQNVPTKTCDQVAKDGS